MIKHIAILASLFSLPFAAQAAQAVPNAYQQAITCKDNNCPYTYEFISTPKVKKSIQQAFHNSKAQVPSWLFSANSVTVPVVPTIINGNKAIKIDSCKPHDCASDNVVGYYDTKTKKFSGTYTMNGKKIVIQ